MNYNFFIWYKNSIISIKKNNKKREQNMNKSKKTKKIKMFFGGEEEKKLQEKNGKVIQQVWENKKGGFVMVNVLVISTKNNE